MKKPFKNPVELFFDAIEDKKKEALIQPVNCLFKPGFDSISFESLKKEALKYSDYLRKHYKIEKGTKILLMIPFSIEMYISVLSIFLLGGCVVFIEPWIGRDLFKEVLNSINTKFVISGFKNRWLLKVFGFIDRNKIFIKPPSRNKKGELIKKETKNTSKEDIAVITFSTGSSGTPKPIKRSYGDLIFQMQRLSNHIRKENSVDFVSFPNLVLYSLSQHTTTIIPEKGFKGSTPINKKTLKNCMEKKNLSRLFISVSHLSTIQDKDIFEKIDSIYTGGSIIEKSFIKKYNLAKKIRILYGSTEIEPISTINGMDFLKIKERGIPVGKVDNSLEIKIDPLEKNIGEILIKYKDRTKSPVKWTKTGDVGYLNKDNILILMGRKIDVFPLNGRYIYPYEIQNIMDEAGISQKIIPFVKNGRFLIIVEGRENKKTSIKICKSLKKRKLFPYKTVFMEGIPRDPRHRAKIDMKKLSEKMKSYL
jgi:olefin beta-lactone synthetase